MCARERSELELSCCQANQPRETLELGTAGHTLLRIKYLAEQRAASCVLS